VEARHGPTPLEVGRLKLVYRGAEADIYSGDWSGEPAVFKFRKPLPYRLPELDAEIRGQRSSYCTSRGPPE